MDTNREIKTNKELKNSINENLENTNKEPNVFVNNPKELRPTDPPMSMEGKPDLSTPKGDTEITIKYEDNNGSIRKKKIALRRLTVNRREAVAWIMLRMFQQIGALTDGGLDVEKINIQNIENAYVMSSGLRQIAPQMTEYGEEFWANVSFGELTKLLDWLFKEEVGLMRTIQDFLSMEGKTIKKQA